MHLAILQLACYFESVLPALTMDRSIQTIYAIIRELNRFPVIFHHVHRRRGAERLFISDPCIGRDVRNESGFQAGRGKVLGSANEELGTFFLSIDQDIVCMYCRLLRNRVACCWYLRYGGCKQGNELFVDGFVNDDAFGGEAKLAVVEDRCCILASVNGLHHGNSDFTEKTHHPKHTILLPSLDPHPPAPTPGLSLQAPSEPASSTSHRPVQSCSLRPLTR
jgi:hypothetical protein